MDYIIIVLCLINIVMSHRHGIKLGYCQGYDDGRADAIRTDLIRQHDREKVI